jgi:hypothetical protein
VGVVSLVKNITLKLKEKRTIYVFVRYAKNHTSDYYRIWCEQTKKYYLIRNIVFLYRIYYKKSIQKNKIIAEPMKILLVNNNSLERQYKNSIDNMLEVESMCSCTLAEEEDNVNNDISSVDLEGNTDASISNTDSVNTMQNTVAIAQSNNNEGAIVTRYS